MRFHSISTEKTRHRKKKTRLFLNILIILAILFVIIFFWANFGKQKNPLNGDILHKMPSTNKEMLTFFNISDYDASKVTWSHAVNSRKKLNDALTENTMFLEADILMIDGLHSEPIMAHPPDIQSDLTFSEWLDLTILKRRGLKLDFKTPNSIEPCLKVLNTKRNEISGPIILNADVFEGNNAPPVKIQPLDLILRAQELFPNGILSIGWTTTKSLKSYYRWCDVYNAFSYLQSKNLTNPTAEITFPVSALWATKSVFRLAWLLVHTSSALSSSSSTLTVWSHATDELSSLESLLLFRRVFDNHLVYYDLSLKHDNFLKDFIYRDSIEWNRKLDASTDEYVKEFLAIEKANTNIQSNWKSTNGVFMSKFGAVMVKNKATLSSVKQYKARNNDTIYEIRGDTNQTEKPSNTKISDEKQSEYLRISLRSAQTIDLSKHSSGSVNIYFYMSGLIKIFVGDKLEQEANLQSSSVYEYLITDVGEADYIHIDVNSYDLDNPQSNPYSLELFVKAAYEHGQEFYAHKCLTSDLYAIGVDFLSISDEISDPQNNN